MNTDAKLSMFEFITKCLDLVFLRNKIAMFGVTDLRKNVTYHTGETRFMFYFSFQFFHFSVWVVTNTIIMGRFASS